MSDERSIHAALRGTHGWREAVKNLVAHVSAEGECFSSGEMVCFIRTYQSDLHFAVESVGELIREMFYNGKIHYQDAAGHQQPAYQVPRITQGLYPDRTPEGVEVFVYCPDKKSGEHYAFEVYIPRPGEGTRIDSATNVNQLPPKPRADPYDPSRSHGVQLRGHDLSAADLKAVVWTDGRLCISRPCLEAFVHETGVPLRSGDPVHVAFDMDGTQVTTIHIYRDPNDHTVECYLSHVGRVVISSQGTPWHHGDSFDITLSKTEICIKTS